MLDCFQVTINGFIKADLLRNCCNGFIVLVRADFFRTDFSALSIGVRRQTEKAQGK